MKITAIHSGKDGANVDYLILPEGMDTEKEKATYLKWYWLIYCPNLQVGTKYLSFPAWLEQRGARRPTKNELEIVRV